VRWLKEHPFAADSAVTFLGVATLAPLIARPVAGFLGSPLRRTSGVAGVLARQTPCATRGGPLVPLRR
jgi:hypothetical protein